MSLAWIAQRAGASRHETDRREKTEWAKEMDGILTLLSGFEHQVFHPPVVWYRGSDPGGPW